MQRMIWRTLSFFVMTFLIVFVTSERRLSAQTDADWDWTGANSLVWHSMP